jgi:LysM domain
MRATLRLLLALTLLAGQSATPILTFPGATRYLPNPLPTVLPGSLFEPRFIHEVRIQHGDTLSGLACRYGTTVADIQDLNAMGGSTTIVAGRTILVLGMLLSRRC